jgi:hypothetical protein
VCRSGGRGIGQFEALPTECGGRFIDDQIELSRLFHRKTCGARSFEDRIEQRRGWSTLADCTDTKGERGTYQRTADPKPN